MAYDAKLEERIQKKRGAKRVLVVKKMFGGAGFMMDGTLSCGIRKDDLIVRIDPRKHNEIMKPPLVKAFETMGGPMAGWILVEPDGCKTEEALADWLGRGVEFAGSLAPK
ncbi:MAG TPA: TfoX/Sxy family protein [Anaerolineales bacterium]|nr:TfoX/Sxy family protein [Anaerolineales bacterium]